MCCAKDFASRQRSYRGLQVNAISSTMHLRDPLSVRAALKRGRAHAQVATRECTAQRRGVFCRHLLRAGHALKRYAPASAFPRPAEPCRRSASSARAAIERGRGRALLLSCSQPHRSRTSVSGSAWLERPWPLDSLVGSNRTHTLELCLRAGGGAVTSRDMGSAVAGVRQRRVGRLAITCGRPTEKHGCFAAWPRTQHPGET